MAGRRYCGAPFFTSSNLNDMAIPVETMPAVLAEIRAQPSGAGDTASQLLDSPAALQRILTQLRSATGHDFFGYKRSTIARRIARRMAAIGQSDPAAYAARMKEQPAEAKALFHELLINVTRFFRDPAAFEAIRAQVLPGLIPMQHEQAASQARGLRLHQAQHQLSGNRGVHRRATRGQDAQARLCRQRVRRGHHLRARLRRGACGPWRRRGTAPQHAKHQQRQH